MSAYAVSSGPPSSTAFQVISLVSLGGAGLYYKNDNVYYEGTVLANDGPRYIKVCKLAGDGS